MAKDLNKVMLIGRLGQDPEVRYTQSGTAVCSISMATTDSVKRGDQWEDETDWHNLVFWGRLAEIVGEYLGKGSKLFVEGKQKTRSWEDRDGNKRYTTEVIVRDMIMLDTRQAGNGGGGNAEGPPPAGEDDVPF